MKEFVKPTLILASVTLCAGILLAGVNMVTHERIQMLNAQKEQNALSVVLPGFSDITEKNRQDLQYWTAEKQKDGETVRAFAFITEQSGYSGTIRTMVGIDENFTILGISILSQTETPGLGARCIEVASSNTFFDVIIGNFTEEEDAAPWFQKQFRKLDASKQIAITKKGDWNETIADDLRQGNEITAITGATITTKAVRDSIVEGIETYKSIISE